MKSELERADPAALAAFDPRTKACTMNCGPSFDDPRSPEERRLLCPDCETVKVPRQQDFDWADKQLPAGITRQDVCIWTQDSDGPWNTSCGVTWEYNDGGPAENKAHFCHHCGGVLLADPFADDDAQPNKGNDWPPLKDAPVPESPPAEKRLCQDGKPCKKPGECEARGKCAVFYGTPMEELTAPAATTEAQPPAQEAECATIKAAAVPPEMSVASRATTPPAAPSPAALSAEQFGPMRMMSTGYQDVFNAISAAVKIKAGAISISVSKFLAAIPTASLQPPAQGNAEVVDRGDAVNLASNIISRLDTGSYNTVTDKGVKCLADAVIRMDAALSRQPSQQGPSEEASRSAITRIKIPTDTMEQEFQSHYRRGYEAGKAAAISSTTAPKQAVTWRACKAESSQGTFGLDGWLCHTCGASTASPECRYATRSSSAGMIAVPRDTLQFVYDIVDIVGCVPGPTDAEGERHLEVLKSALSARRPV